MWQVADSEYLDQPPPLENILQNIICLSMREKAVCLRQLEGIVTLFIVPGSYFLCRDVVIMKTCIPNHYLRYDSCVVTYSIVVWSSY